MIVNEQLAIDHGLKKDEYKKICDLLKRVPNITELGIFSAMWNEHCSYKSSRFHIKNVKRIEDNNQIALEYCDVHGVTSQEFNPNGSMHNIAGVYNEKKNILGMMPHPERMIDKYLSGEDGSLFFKNLLNNLK